MQHLLDVSKFHHRLKFCKCHSISAVIKSYPSVHIINEISPEKDFQDIECIRYPSCSASQFAKCRLYHRQFHHKLIPCSIIVSYFSMENIGIRKARCVVLISLSASAPLCPTRIRAVFISVSSLASASVTVNVTAYTPAVG